MCKMKYRSAMLYLALILLQKTIKTTSYVDKSKIFLHNVLRGGICANIMEYVKCKGELRMFRVKQTEEMINKTFRLPSTLLDELAKVAEHEKRYR